MWEHAGMARNKKDLQEAIIQIKLLRNEFWTNVKVPGKSDELNPELEKAGRVADFLEIGELIAKDALQREESCGGHFREEYQTTDGEALRDDKNFALLLHGNIKAPKRNLKCTKNLSTLNPLK